jgi:hypothetical protein
MFLKCRKKYKTTKLQEGERPLLIFVYEINFEVLHFPEIKFICQEQRQVSFEDVTQRISVLGLPWKRWQEVPPKRLCLYKIQIESYPRTRVSVSAFHLWKSLQTNLETISYQIPYFKIIGE